MFVDHVLFVIKIKFSLCVVLYILRNLSAVIPPFSSADTTASTNILTNLQSLHSHNRAKSVSRILVDLSHELAVIL